MRMVILYFDMLAVMRGDLHINDADLPTDAAIIGATIDDTRRAFTLYIRSAAFDVVPEGMEIPMLPPQRMRRVARNRQE